MLQHKSYRHTKNKSKPQISRDLKYTNILNVAAIKFVSDVWLSNHHDIYANHCHSISINCHSCQGPSSYWSRPAVVYFFQASVLFFATLANFAPFPPILAIFRIFGVLLQAFIVWLTNMRYGQGSKK